MVLKGKPYVKLESATIWKYAYIDELEIGMNI